MKLELCPSHPSWSLTASFQAALKLLTASQQQSSRAIRPSRRKCCSTAHCVAAGSDPVGLPKLARALSLALGAQPGKPPAMPCTFRSTGEGNQINLCGLVAITAMSLDTHPTHCPGRPWRGAGMISSRTAGVRVSPAWSCSEHNLSTSEGWTCSTKSWDRFRHCVVLGSDLVLPYLATETY